MIDEDIFRLQITMDQSRYFRRGVFHSTGLSISFNVFRWIWSYWVNQERNVGFLSCSGWHHLKDREYLMGSMVILRLKPGRC
jgi:hypothetical protein